MAKLALDFDGVICERYGIPTKGKFEDCPPMEGAVEAIKLLRKDHELYIFTNRDEKDWKKMEKWLADNDIAKIRITNKKELGTVVYLDDRAIRFTSWKDFCKMFV